MYSPLGMLVNLGKWSYSLPYGFGDFVSGTFNVHNRHAEYRASGQFAVFRDLCALIAFILDGSFD
jgi:hypothetical protein